MQNQTWNLKRCLAAKHACSLSLSLSPFNPLSVSVFFEEVASQTGIGVQLQHLLYLGHELPLEGNMKVVNLPRTSPARPLILLSYGPEAHNSLPFRERKTIKDTYTFDMFLWSVPFLHSLLFPWGDMKEFWNEVYSSISLTQTTHEYFCESAVLCKSCGVIFICQDTGKLYTKDEYIMKVG